MKISIELLLTVIFFALKVAGTTTMSWLWVFSPIWISWGLVIIIVVCVWIREKLDGIFFG
jgi:hypothetical protein